MQSADLYELIQTKLSKSLSAVYNQPPQQQIIAASPPGENYWTMIQDNLDNNGAIIIEYHTPTHYYTLNNAYLDTSIELHNQFRTIMRTAGIKVAVCEEHSIVEHGGETWVYNAWQKPVQDTKPWAERFFRTSDDNSTLINSLTVNIISTMNVFADAPTGTRIWPIGFSKNTMGPMTHFANNAGEWFWTSPLTYVNRMEIDPSSAAIVWLSLSTVAASLHSSNPHFHLNPNFYNSYFDNINSEVFDVDALRGEVQ
jgi:hypothetical protein